MNKLPTGWAMGKFDDLLDYIQPTRFIVETTDYDESFKTPVLTAGKSFIKGYTNETDGIFTDLPVIIFDDFTTATKFVDFPFKVKSSAMKILKPKHDLVNIKYVFYFMQTLREMTETHKRYWISTFSKLPIPLPPLPEQRRIVARIEELFSRLDAGVAALRHAKAQLLRYRQSVLAAAVTGQLTQAWREQHPDTEPADELLKRILEQKKEQWNGRGKYTAPAQLPSEFELPDLPASWINAALGQVYHLQRGRFSVRPRNDPRFYDGPHPFVQIGDLPRAGGTIRNYQQTLNEAGLGVSKMFKAGTPLIAIVGATIGNTGTLGFDSCCPDSLVAIQSEIEPLTRYAELYLQAHKLRIRRDSYSSGGQPNINIAYLEIQPLALPPLAEQHQIVAEVEARTTAIDHLEAELDRQITRSNRLRQSILHAAFAGHWSNAL